MNKKSIAKTVSLVERLVLLGVQGAEGLLTTVEPSKDKSGQVIPNSQYWCKANHMTRRKQKLYAKAKDLLRGNIEDPKEVPKVLCPGTVRETTLKTKYERREAHLAKLAKELARHKLSIGGGSSSKMAA